MNNEEEYMRIQTELRNKISLSDSFEISELKTAAGVDLAYWKQGNDEYAVCCIVIIDMNTHEILERKHYSGIIEVPYIPGFLAFRELPLVLETAKMLEIQPDIYIFDGNFIISIVTAIYSEHIFRQNKSRKLSNIRDLSMYIYSSFYFMIFLPDFCRQEYNEIMQ